MCSSEMFLERSQLKKSEYTQSQELRMFRDRQVVPWDWNYRMEEDEVGVPLFLFG